MFENYLIYTVKNDLREFQLEAGDEVYIDRNAPCRQGDIVATYDPAAGLRLERLDDAAGFVPIIGKAIFFRRHLQDMSPREEAAVAVSA